MNRSPAQGCTLVEISLTVSPLKSAAAGCRAPKLPAISPPKAVAAGLREAKSVRAVVDNISQMAWTGMNRRGYLVQCRWYEYTERRFDQMKAEVGECSSPGSYAASRDQL